ncbi:MAG: GDSL-type esterase/lipase family protein [Limisphaerales bacterium]
MKSIILIFTLTAALLLPSSIVAQTNTTPAPPKNTAIIPVPRTDSATNRQALVLQRAKEAPGDYDIEFIGDSITQGWEGAGKNIWQAFYGQRKVINMGVGGDRTQHVLWRFENGQLDGIKAKVAVVMIGTNNRSDTPGQVLEGVTAIVQQIRVRQPATKSFCSVFFPAVPLSTTNVQNSCKSTRHWRGLMMARILSLLISVRS